MFMLSTYSEWGRTLSVELGAHVWSTPGTPADLQIHSKYTSIYSEISLNKF